MPRREAPSAAAAATGSGHAMGASTSPRLHAPPAAHHRAPAVNRVAVLAASLLLLVGSTAYFMADTLSQWAPGSASLAGVSADRSAVQRGRAAGLGRRDAAVALAAGDADDGGASAAAEALAESTRTRLTGALRRSAHVLLVSHDMYMQGSQFFLLRLAMGLRAMGWQHIEVVAPQDGPMRKVLNEKGFFVHVVKSVPEWLVEHGAGYAVIHYNTVVMCWAHLHAAPPPGGAAAAAPALPGAAFWTIHESRPDSGGLGLAARCPQLARAFDATRGVFFVATSTQAVYAAKGWLEPRRTGVVYNGLELELFDETLASLSQAEARRQLGIPGDALVVISAGTLCARKGQLDLANAFVRVLAAYEASDPAAAARQPLHLYLVGAERQPWVKAYEAQVEAVAASAGARGRIHVVDRTETAGATRAYFRASDVHALHASDESMPFVCMESMALGLPQVATRVFGIPELVRDGREGLIYDHLGNETRELESKLLSLVRDPALRARLGASGAQRIRADFTVAKMAAKYDAWYVDALTQGPDGGGGAPQQGAAS